MIFDIVYTLLNGSKVKVNLVFIPQNFLEFQGKEELNDLIKLVEQNEPPKEAPNPSDWMEIDDETEVGKGM